MTEEQIGSEPQIDIAERLLESGGISLDRLPMLKVVIDRLASFCADGFRQISSAPIYIVVRDISVGRIGQILDSYETRAIAASYQVTEWDSRILLGLDRPFVFSLLEVLFGGDGSEPAVTDERALTSVELRVAQRAFDITVASLKASFGSVADLTFVYERTEARLEFAIAGRRNNLAVLVRLNFQVFDRTGEIFVIIPQQALKSLRQVLANDVTHTVAAPDPRWSRQMEKELHRTEVVLTAILDSYKVTLGEIANWRVGDVVPLMSIDAGHLRLECENQPVFRCELGRARGYYNVQIEDSIDPEAQFIDDMISQ
jgi:flagellar motor switch protein FliM